jgi:trehalose-phosphatase
VSNSLGPASAGTPASAQWEPTLAAALEGAASAERLLVATDFDGVVAPLQRDPLAVRPTEGVMDDLRALAGLPGVTVALVSGRDQATLARLSGIRPDDPVTLIASHGAESTSAAVRSAMTAAAVGPEDRERLAGLRDEVEALVAERHPLARVELKTAGVVVHTRGLSTEHAEAALAEARGIGAGHDGVRVLEGKSVVELSISLADKGSALLALAEEVGADARVYLGDDVTDEDAFTRLTGPADVTVKVGEGATAAGHRIRDTAAVATLLRDLLERRRAARPQTS